jgi:hypothetical protein
MASPCCCGTPSCRLAMNRRFLSIVGSSTWSTACPAVRSTSTSSPTPCFLMGSCGPHGLLGMTWITIWRRLSRGAHRIVLIAPAWHRGHSHFTVPDPGLLQSGVDDAHWWGMQCLSGPLPWWLGIPSEICPALVPAAAWHPAHRCLIASLSLYLCKGGQIP